MREVGNPTMVFNNAGIARMQNLCDRSTANIEKLVNLTSHMHIIKKFLPKMIEADKGHIIATSSMSSYLPIAFEVPYVGTKFAVRGYMEALRMELAYKTENIVLSTVFPLFVDTPMLHHASDVT